MTTTIIGSPVSPYVRKVLAVLGLKGVSYAIDPLVPFLANDAFAKISPLRRIPVRVRFYGLVHRRAKLSWAPVESSCRCRSSLCVNA